MAFFGRSKPQRTEAYLLAERVLDQTEAFCNSVLEYVDGTSEGEKRMIAEVNGKLANAARLRESLQEGSLDPQMCTTMGFALTFNQLVQIVNNLDGSTPAETDIIDAAKRQISAALKAGYGPALEMQQKGELKL